MLLDIVKYPDPLLKKKSAPAGCVDDEIRGLVENMFETMYAASGVGLAAPQVGISKRVIVIDVGRMEEGEKRSDRVALINPEIKSRKGTITWEEGCLSCPYLVVPVERSSDVTVSALTVDGEETILTGEGLLAVAIQHEIDHLDGVTLADRLSRLKRDIYRRKLEKGEPFEPIKTGSKGAYI